MRKKDIENNIYSLKKKYPKKIPIIISFLSFLTLLLLLAKFQIETSLTLDGIYTCSKTCSIKTVLPLNEIKKLREKEEIKVNQKKVPLKIKEFGEIMELENKLSVQNVILEIPKQDYYEKQTIEIQIIKEKESLLKLILKSMKGGEE